jgi:hypothetical protein
VGPRENLVHNTCSAFEVLNDPKAVEGMTPNQIDDLARNLAM